MTEKSNTTDEGDASEAVLQAHANLDALLSALLGLIHREQEPSGEDSRKGPRTIASVEGQECSYVLLRVPRPRKVQRLTPREKQIAALASAGYSNRSIAQILDIRDATVSAHLKQVLQKLHINSRVELTLQQRYFE